MVLRNGSDAAFLKKAVEKQPVVIGQCPFRCGNDVERALHLQPSDPYLLDHAGLQFILHGVPGEDRDPEVGLDRFLDGRAGAEGGADIELIDPQVLFRQKGFDVLSGAGPFLAHQEGQADQLLRVDGLRQIPVLCRDEDEFVLEERLVIDLSGRQADPDNADQQVIAGDAVDDRGGIADPDFKGNPGVSGLE